MGELSGGTLLQRTACSFYSVLENGEKEGGGNGHQEAGLGGDESLGNAGRDAIERLEIILVSDAGEGIEHPGHRAEKTTEGSKGDEHRKYRQPALHPGELIQFEEFDFIAQKLFVGDLAEGVFEMVDLMRERKEPPP